MADTGGRVEQIERKLFGPGVDSDTRLEVLLLETFREPPDVFWAVMASAWCQCDATWRCQGWLLDTMRAQPTRAAVAGPWPKRIYRGCSRPRVRGVSWTTSRTVAEGFAHGHRFIRVPDPVIAEAEIEREGVFFATDERGEAELLIDPRRLRRLKVCDYISACSEVCCKAA